MNLEIKTALVVAVVELPILIVYLLFPKIFNWLDKKAGVKSEGLIHKEQLIALGVLRKNERESKA